VRAGGAEAIVPLAESAKFQVYRPEKLSVAPGEKIGSSLFHVGRRERSSLPAMR
jgi:hypothetical protein